MKLSECRAFLSGVGLGSLGRTGRASSRCPAQPCEASGSLSRPYLCFRICLLSSMVTLSAWSLLKISKASWRPNDISSLIPVGDTRKWPQSQHQDPINFIVTLVRPERRPWLPEAHGGKRLLTRQVAPGSSSRPPTREPSQPHPLHPAGWAVPPCDCGGWGLECLVEGNENQSAKPSTAKNICKYTFCHHSVPYFSLFSCSSPLGFSVKFHPEFPGI